MFMRLCVRQMSHFARLSVVTCSAVLLATGVLAQAPQKATPLQTMEREARVSRDAARRTALSQIPGGRISSIELRRGIGGKLVYNASIAVPGKPQKAEVVVDAMTGAVVSKRQ
jgi:uncharacterized membrane protein YkoI